MYALPFSTLEKTIKKAISNYPEIPKTIGDHIKKRRLDLKLTQSKVARILKICVTALSNWEAGLRTPRINHRSKVISFIGFNPWEGPVDTLALKLIQYRNERGLTQAQLAQLLGTDASTISDWEAGHKKPYQKSMKKLKKVLLEV